MDWYSATAGLLGHDAPRVVVDARGVLRLANGAADSLFDGPAREAFGLDLDRASLSGAATGWWTGPGSLRLAFVIDDLPAAGAHLVTFVEAHETTTALEQGVVEYDIDGALTSFGVLVRLHRGDELRRYWRADGPRCHAVLHDRSTPCTECPALRHSTGVFARSRHVEVLPARPDGVRVRLRSRSVRPEVLLAIRTMRLRALAEAARLSPRQRLTLELWIAGRSLGETADELGTTRRTVRHHRKRALAKLDASSRTELLALLW